MQAHCHESMCEPFRAVDFCIGQALKLGDGWLVEKVVDFNVLREDEILLCPKLMHGQHAHTSLSTAIHKRKLLNIALLSLVLACYRPSNMSLCLHGCVLAL